VAKMVDRRFFRARVRTHIELKRAREDLRGGAGLRACLAGLIATTLGGTITLTSPEGEETTTAITLPRSGLGTPETIMLSQEAT
jgi:signal transduction histidine kinase